MQFVLEREYFEGLHYKKELSFLDAESLEVAKQMVEKEKKEAILHIQSGTFRIGKFYKIEVVADFSATDS